MRPIIAEKNNSFTLTCNDALHDIVSDRPILRQALLNLLSNAFKFTENGFIKLDVQPGNANKDSDGRPWVEFTVSDTGIGISSEAQDRVFDAFVQADSSTTRKYGGTGLGLTICRKFAESLGGSLTLESIEGQGSSFVLRVPA